MPQLFKAFLSLVAACALLAGCAATPEASRQSDAEAKRFDSAPGAAIVYLYRADLPNNRGVSTLWLDGRLIGELLPATYFRVAVRPGKNLLTALAGDTGRLEFETRGGEVYFIAISVLGNDGAGVSHFRIVSPDVSRAQIERCCTLLETWKPGQNRIPL
jgi:hypothetical protein